MDAACSVGREWQAGFSTEVPRNSSVLGLDGPIGPTVRSIIVWGHVSGRSCPRCQARMVRSHARGAHEDLAFMMGSDILRCASCGARFLCFRRFSIPAPGQRDSVGNNSDDGAFAIVWIAIFAGLLTCLGIALWILHRFHRWPF